MGGISCALTSRASPRQGRAIISLTSLSPLFGCVSSVQSLVHQFSSDDLLDVISDSQGRCRDETPCGFQPVSSPRVTTLHLCLRPPPSHASPFQPRVRNSVCVSFSAPFGGCPRLDGRVASSPGRLRVRFPGAGAPSHPNPAGRHGQHSGTSRARGLPGDPVPASPRAPVTPFTAEGSPGHLLRSSCLPVAGSRGPGWACASCPRSDPTAGRGRGPAARPSVPPRSAPSRQAAARGVHSQSRAGCVSLGRTWPRAHSGLWSLNIEGNRCPFWEKRTQDGA